MLDLSISIVNQNCKDWTRNCIESIYRNTHNLTYEILVVDNNSSDGSVEMIKSRYPDVKLIENKTIRGFSENHNAAIRKAQGKYISLLNEDMEITDRCYEIGIAFLEDCPEVAAVCPKLINPDGSLQPSIVRADFFNPKQSLWKLMLFSKFEWKKHFKGVAPDSISQTNILNGAGYIIRKDVFDSVGLLDENYVIYMEEDDLFRRIRSAGYKLYHLPSVQIIHYGGQSIKKVSEKAIIESYRSHLYYCLKHYSKIEFFGLFILSKTMLILKSIFALLLPAEKNPTKKNLGLKWRLLKIYPPTPGFAKKVVSGSAQKYRRKSKKKK